MDRRTQRTRKAIYEAFSTLLSRKKYSQITIQEIIDTADIGRSTFYSHFQAKEDLLKEVCTQLFAGHVFCAPPRSGESDQEELEELQEILEHTLNHLARDGKMIRGILASESRGYFIACFKEYIDEFAVRYVLRGREEQLTRVDPAYLKNHITASFVETVQWWLDQGSQPPAGEMARQYLCLIAPLLPWFEK